MPLLCVAAFIFWKKNEIVCHFVRQELAARYPDYHIDIGALRLEPKGVILDRLHVSMPQQQGGEIPLFEAEEILVQMPLSLSTLIQKKVQPRHVLISRPVITITPQSLAALGAISKGGEPVEIPYVPVDIRGASLEVALPAKGETGEPRKMVYTGIDASLTPPAAASAAPGSSAGPAAATPAPQTAASSAPPAAPARNGGRRFGDDPLADGFAALSMIGDALTQKTPTAPSGGAGSSGTAPPAQTDPNRWQIRGTCENSFVKGIAFDGSAEPDFSFVTITGKVDALEVGQKMVSPLVDLSAVKDTIQSFTGRTSFGFTIEWSAERGLNYRIDGNLFQGSFTTPYLSHPVSDLFVHFHIDPANVTVNRLTARSGASLILADYAREGPQNRWQMRAQLEEFPISQEMLTLLPESAGGPPLGTLADLTFAGTAKINISLNGEGKKITRPAITVTCKDLVLSHQVFPFKPDPLSGTLRLDEEGRLRFLFKTEGETRRLRLSGEYPNLADRQGTVHLEAERLPIDSRLIASVPEDYRDVIESLNPGGYLNASVDLAQSAGKPDDLRMTIDLSEASIKYDLFPMPVSGISGRVTCENGNWVFSDLSGSSGPTRFTAEGTAGTAGETDRFNLNVHAERFPLGEEFRAALTDPEQRHQVETLHLRGAADADIRLTFVPEKDALDLEIDGVTRPEETAIQPDHFPYELTDLEGQIQYREGVITIDNLRGRNGAAAVSASIRSQFGENGSYTVRISPFTVDQLQMDHRLQRALPPKLFPLFEEMALSGSFNITGAIQWHAESADAPVEVAWNTELVLFRNSVQCAKPITDICGKTLLCGYMRGDETAVYSLLDIDSLFAGGVQVSQVGGPLYYDGSDVLLGSAVPPVDELSLFQCSLFRDLTSVTFQGPRENGVYAAAPRRPITGRMFHGDATLSGMFTPSSSQAYKLEFRLQDGSLEEAARDLNEHATVLPGNVSIFATIQGEGKNWDTAKGSGGLSIQNASLYQLPLMIQILRSLSINEKESAGFDTAFVDFQIYGNRLQLDRVLLEGSSMTLFGDGWLTLEGDEPKLDLTLSSRLGQVRDQLPLVSDVLGTAGDQIAQIKVEGPLSNAEIRRDNFPGIKKAVWSIFPGAGKKLR
ncbi:MAG: hypothetical protein IJG60_04265 [Thermoguttaceae bacterium]|nr:hypothetical protein [Thermoguttaceae bacterium]